MAGLRSMSHIPRDERQRLFTDREQSCELLASRVKVLRERISRKDDLLQGYEKDLSKLRLDLYILIISEWNVSFLKLNLEVMAHSPGCRFLDFIYLFIYFFFFFQVFRF